MNISQLLNSLKDPQNTLTIGEKLLAGFSVTILSMTVVFIVLVIIAGIISLLQKENKKIENKVIENKVGETSVTESEDMNELIAVITAAICATTGSNSSDIVVKRIARSNNSKSSWETMNKK